MLLAVKSNLWWIAAGLFVVLLVTSKSKYLIAASAVGGVLAALVYLTPDLGEYRLWLIVGGLFLILILISRKESEHPTPDQYGGYGGM